uniref:C-type lectin domain family 11 member A-like n=1 Tax=Myxine glutinosa TaxID=7769 RepID=UPI00358EA39E
MERAMSEITKATTEARSNTKVEADSDITNADERTVQRQSASLREMKARQGRVEARLAQLEAQTLRHEGKLRKLRDTGRNNSLATARHRNELGRLSGCLRGRRISGRCYLLFREYASHEQAASRCEDTGGSLAAPSDATTRRAIARYARSAVSGNWFVWIGVTDHRAEGVYIYSDGSRVISAPWYRAYPVVQPNGGHAENCVVFTVSDGAWWDSPCSGRHLFLCQYAF